ncbi:MULTISPECIES: haloacid dehalogenase type II [unclassified Achromobacter]|uniref:haloacid dehalogenase type II n=1 Tax=unclassified Achromobacter TaxID=2626865 RepID=UPI000B51769F|nr:MULTISPECIES: haloacid dehalogenase type II [unclassified Achromobacter]OWT68234.1 haloacid dehalogenase, type II [Achromobacter sp. HZ34]OWT70071.1 haloacid dehalogenase, type II [Achromobacter sp. HZ28]
MAQQNANEALAGSAPIKALVFDTFGTVVNWRDTVIHELRNLGRAKGLDADWVAMADAWRAGYAPGMDTVRKGLRPWTSVDVLHRERLDVLLKEFQVEGLTEAEKDHLNRVWHRLDPWPDSVAGLRRLKSKYIISTFSNGSVPCLVNMAKHGGLPWDCVFSSDIVRHYKPDAEMYLGVAEFLGLPTSQVMVVAAHNNDLRHARANGLRTGYIHRPTEYGVHQSKDLRAEEDWDEMGEDIGDFATKMGV